MKLTTTFARLKREGACPDGYKKLVTHLGDVRRYGKDKPIDLATVLESNGLRDTLWCLQATEQDWLTDVRPMLRLYLADVLEHILPSAGKKADLFTEGIALLRDPQTTVAQLQKYANAAYDAANAAAYAAAYAYDAANAAAYAAAYANANAAAYAAANAAAYAAANAYANAANAYANAAAYDAANAAAYAAANAAAYDARDVEGKWQAERLRQYLTDQVTHRK